MAEPEPPPVRYRTIWITAVAEVTAVGDQQEAAQAYEALAELLRYCAEKRRSGDAIRHVPLETGQAIRWFELDARRGWLPERSDSG